MDPWRERRDKSLSFFGRAQLRGRDFRRGMEVRAWCFFPFSGRVRNESDGVNFEIFYFHDRVLEFGNGGACDEGGDVGGVFDENAPHRCCQRSGIFVNNEKIELIE